MSDQINSLREQLKLRKGTAKPMPATRLAVSKSDSFLSRLLKKPASWVRRHERFGCCVVAVLDVIDKNVPIDGLVTEISQGGLLFRPASTYIFDRRGASVVVRFGDEEVEGKIVNVKSSGYGVLFHHEVSVEHVSRLLEHFGLRSEAEAA
ncbi:MAG: PilZ domain-containing protein [Bosea sp. (in: a-proteobacteria)]